MLEKEVLEVIIAHTAGGGSRVASSLAGAGAGDSTSCTAGVSSCGEEVGAIAGLFAAGIGLGVLRRAATLGAGSHAGSGFVSHGGVGAWHFIALSPAAHVGVGTWKRRRFRHGELTEIDIKVEATHTWQRKRPLET